jgi:hypothetical protein
LIVDGLISIVDLITLLIEQRLELARQALEFFLYGFDIFLNLLLSGGGINLWTYCSTISLVQHRLKLIQRHE